MAADTPEDAEDDPRPWRDLMVEAARNARRLSAATSRAKSDPLEIPDPGVVAKTMFDVVERTVRDPSALYAAQANMAAEFGQLLQVTAKRMAGEEADPVVAPKADDRRFKDKAWTEDPAFDFLKQSYLIMGRWMEAALSETPGLDDQTRKRASFYLRQYVDAVAPGNFAPTNPQALRVAAETGGESLLRGFGSMLDDIERGEGELKIRTTDDKAFEIGRNIATTEGAVVHRTDLAELIQYAPTTESAHKTPVLIIPPWINKYYILDLQPKNSMVKWLVDQGHTVFILSWANPDGSFRHKDFEDYMSEGPLSALDAIREITGERQVHMTGFCLGGTLLAATLAYMAAMGDDRAQSATFLTTMLDFADPGELGVFIDEEQLAQIDSHMDQHGFLDGRHMARVFSMMRDRDLIWSFYVNNYLLGREPQAFDLLFWNNDSTRMPQMMQRFYLRKMYLENRLKDAGGIALRGRSIDLGRITTPAFFLSAKEDHIAPWRSTYAGVHLLRGDSTFVLSESGHIAGVVNSPLGRGKYGHYVNDDAPLEAEGWIDGAERRDGSWWPLWSDWLIARGVGRDGVPARGVGGALADAPGEYVRVRS